MQEKLVAEIQQILHKDSQQEVPVVQSMSLFFWQALSQWLSSLARPANQPPSKSFTIALAGASGSGKSYIREELESSLLSISKIASFTQDNYYRDFKADFPHLSLTRFYDEIDFDDPTHIRFDKLADDLQRVKKANYGDILKLPKLCYGTPQAKPTIIPEGQSIQVASFIITEGIFAFYDLSLTHLYDLKIFVDIDENKRRERWLARNIRDNRGTTDNMWQTTVHCLKNHILPSREVADLVINNNVPQTRIKDFIQETTLRLAHIVHQHRQDAALTNPPFS